MRSLSSHIALWAYVWTWASTIVTAAAAGGPRFVLYLDQYHTLGLPQANETMGIKYVNVAFANSSLFASDPAGQYTPFKSVSDIRLLFDEGVKVCLAIGGWADTAGFSEGSRTSESRQAYAKNVADAIDGLGFDCVDVDWEYPGGNGEDYRRIPNEKKTSEIQAFPLLLEEIKKAIGDKELSIAVPGLERDMIAYTPEQVAKMNRIVNFVNVMSYDLMNRRDNRTTHHTSVSGTLACVNTYIARGFDPAKLNFGIPFYAKWFTTKQGITCDHPIGCATEPLEAADGSDTGLSGAVTFESKNFNEVLQKLTLTSDSSCGAGTPFMCGDAGCCSQAGFCDCGSGTTPEYCGAGCQSAYGRCDGPDVINSFRIAIVNGKTDLSAGAQWYWDAETRLFWSWDTADLIMKKFDVLFDRGVGGCMAWSLGEDSHDWSHLKAMQRGYDRYAKRSRPKLAAAMVCVSQDRGRPDIIFLAVDIADRFIAALDGNPPPADILGLLGGVALLIAAKYEGHREDAQLANSVAAHYDRCYDRSAILRAERRVLSVIDYDLSWPGPLPFLNRIIAENESEAVVHFASQTLLRRAVACQRFVHILPSMLAALCYRLAQQDLTGQDWVSEPASANMQSVRLSRSKTETHVRSSGYDEEKLRPMLAILSQCLDKLGCSQLKSPSVS
ncbi:42 kDa endochitinase [Ilyonectria robusta]